MLRKSKSHLLASALIAGGMMGALSVATATGAEAAVQTYTVTSDHCTGGCLPDTSTITATDVGSNLDITVTLASGDEFMSGPTGTGTAGKNTFGFQFSLSPITIASSLTSPPWTTNTTSSVNGSFSAGSFAMDGAGAYDYVMDIAGHGPSGVSTLSFTIDNASTADIPSISGVFAADILSGSTGNTGVVDFSLSSVVPEPSTWAMMLVGFVGLGFAGYRKTRKAVLFAG
jgi:PEP-CTERM motif